MSKSECAIFSEISIRKRIEIFSKVGKGRERWAYYPTGEPLSGYTTFVTLLYRKTWKDQEVWCFGGNGLLELYVSKSFRGGYFSKEKIEVKSSLFVVRQGINRLLSESEAKVWQSDHSGNATVSMSWSNFYPFVFFCCQHIDDDDNKYPTPVKKIPNLPLTVLLLDQAAPKPRWS